MYKIPENFNITSLLDEIVTEISFGLNVITLYFNKGYIQLYGSFAFTWEKQRHEYQEIFPLKNDLGLLKLLERKIIKIEISQNRKYLSLFFENEILLELMGNPYYESYRIAINNNEIII